MPLAASNPGNILRCAGGAWSVATTCPTGCTVQKPGVPDACNPPACPCYAGDGDYCGTGSACFAQNNLCTIPNLAGNEGNVLHCAGGTWTVKSTCSNGCFVAPNGTNDGCNPAGAPVCGCYAGDGLYCGAGVNTHEMSSACVVPQLTGNYCNILRCQGGAWSVETSCAQSCTVAPPGTNDYCGTGAGGYYLPWAAGATYTCTQGNNGDICGSNNGDHTGVQAYAWDFGLPVGTPVLATRGGTVTVAATYAPPGAACSGGCTQPFGSADFWNCCNYCLNRSNWVNVDHGDGTVSTYWHLSSVAVSVGQQVSTGAVLGHSGNTGCSSGPHLHYQTMGNCPTGYCQSIPTTFVEAGVPVCGQAVTSQNP